jgi:hypothetical protein
LLHHDKHAGTRLRTWLVLCAIASTACIGVPTCTPVIAPPGDETPDPGTGDTPADDPATDPTPSAEQPADDSVGDVVTDGLGGDSSGDTPQPAVAARIRNESDSRADVTLRFIRGESIVHLAFIRVLPSTVTTVGSPESAELIEASGVNERGAALTGASMAFGTDFDEDTPALYTIPAEPDDPEPDDPEPDQPDPPTLTIVEPDTDQELTLGQTFFARWDDESDTPGAVVRLYLHRIDPPAPELIPLGPAFGASLDGVNDEAFLLVQGIEPGLYEVVGEIDDGTTRVTAIAPGTIEVLADTDNTAPTLTILSPLTLVELHADEFLLVSWDDDDPDDNATVTFSLVSAESADTPVGPFRIGPAFSEDPDGGANDSAVLALADVLPGLYTLSATISDAALEGTDAVTDVVRVLPDLQNDEPSLDLTNPSSGDVVEVVPGGSFLVQWVDSDEDHNALISILLDPYADPPVLDDAGDEILLKSSLAEDQDGGLADALQAVVPPGTPYGDYLVMGEITDGIARHVDWAGGIVRVVEGQTGDGTQDPPIVFNLLEPADDVRRREGGSVEFYLETDNIPDQARINLYLFNDAAEPTDELVRADVTPQVLLENATVTLALPTLADGRIPNTAWPRNFKLEAVLTVPGTEPVSSLAPGDVWIRQEVRLQSVAMVNYACTPDGEADIIDPGQRFFGLQIVWYGGGFEEREAHNDVQFWVSQEDTIPDDGEDTDVARMFRVAPESPNNWQITLGDLQTVVGFRESGDEIVPAIDPGEYRLFMVVDNGDGAPIISPPSVPFDLCRRIRGPG